MKHIRIITLGLAALTPFAYSQEGTQNPKQHAKTTQAQHNTNLVKLSTLNSMSVNHRAVEEGKASKDKVADFADVIVTGHGGEARYILFSRGGLGDIGDTLIPVPQEMVSTTWDRTDEDEAPKIRIFTSLSNKRLGDAPEFDSAAWKKGSFQWKLVADYYGTEAGSTLEASSDKEGGRSVQASANKELLFRLSEFVGSDLRDSQGEKIAEVQNFVLDPQTMKVAYVVVGSGGVLGIGEELRAISFQTLVHTRDKDGKVLCTTRMTKAQLQSAPKFDKDLWSTQGTVRFAESLDKQSKISNDPH